MTRSTRSARGLLRELLYRRGWDTRTRHVYPSRLVAEQARSLPRSATAPVLLDAGCGPAGLAAFLPQLPTLGIDLQAPPKPLPNLTFQRASITQLPLPDRSMPLVACVDVLEHLGPTDRRGALHELVRVSSGSLLVACPQRGPAEEADGRFRRRLQRRNRPLPDWLVEHGAHPCPSVEEVTVAIREAARAGGREADVQVSFCEPVAVTNALRAVAARSGAAYGLLNLLLGVMSPLMGARRRSSSYRLVVLARLGPSGRPAPG